MNSREDQKRVNSIAILGTLICVFTLSGCGSRNEQNVDSKNVPASVTPSNQSTPKAPNSPGPTVLSATTTDKATLPSPTQTRNNESSRVASAPKSQIGTGGNDFFQFTQARAAIGADPEIKSADIVIDVKAGVVTLSGKVASAAQKSKAEQLVRAVDGVKEVNNRLRISN